MISRYRNPLTTALLIVVILAIWESAVRWFSLPTIILPPAIRHCGLPL